MPGSRSRRRSPRGRRPSRGRGRAPRSTSSRGPARCSARPRRSGRGGRARAPSRSRSFPSRSPSSCGRVRSGCARRRRARCDARRTTAACRRRPHDDDVARVVGEVGQQRLDQGRVLGQGVLPPTPRRLVGVEDDGRLVVLGVDARLLRALPRGGDHGADDRGREAVAQRPPVGEPEQPGMADRVGPELDAEPWVADGGLLRGDSVVLRSRCSRCGGPVQPIMVRRARPWPALRRARRCASRRAPGAAGSCRARAAARGRRRRPPPRPCRPRPARRRRRSAAR